MKLFLLLLLVLIPTSVLAEVDLADEVRRLVTDGENRSFEFVGQKTSEQLSKRNGLACVYLVNKGDFIEPFGNSTAENHVVVDCEGIRKLVLRLRKNKDGLVQILGFFNTDAL